jgi:hypothetical protein
MLAATPLTVGGFMLGDTIGFGVLLLVAGVGLFVAARSRWARKVNDSQLGVN